MPMRLTFKKVCVFFIIFSHVTAIETYLYGPFSPSFDDRIDLNRYFPLFHILAISLATFFFYLALLFKIKDNKEELLYDIAWSTMPSALLGLFPILLFISPVIEFIGLDTPLLVFNLFGLSMFLGFFMLLYPAYLVPRYWQLIEKHTELKNFTALSRAVLIVILPFAGVALASFSTLLLPAAEGGCK